MHSTETLRTLVRPFRVLATGLTAGAIACADSSLPSAPSDRPTTAITATASFQVNSTADVVDAAPGNGICRTAAGTCTVRAAIQESNALAGENTINVPAGTYPLSIPPHSGKDDASGSLAITGPLRIFGAGTATTIVDGIAFRNQGYTQVSLKVVATAGSVTLRSLTLRNGGNATGLCGGSNLRVEAGASVVLRKVAVRNGWDYCAAGGIRNSGTLTIDQSEVTGSASASSGGGISNDGTLTLGRSTISANWAEDDAGGISNSGQLTMANSTLSTNSSAFGATGLTNGGSAVLNNVTIARNGEGAGLPTVYTAGSGVTKVSNTIIGGNFGPNCSGTLTSLGYNLIGGTAGCSLVGDGTGNIIGVAPKLGALQNNGGPTPTHALLSGSPARNAGNPATPGSSATACPIGDQRLLPRSATRCDIGAVEMQ
jgi:CSLREA domain-containing protein